MHRFMGLSVVLVLSLLLFCSCGVSLGNLEPEAFESDPAEFRQPAFSSEEGGEEIDSSRSCGDPQERPRYQPENRALMKEDTFTIHEDVPEILVEAHGDPEDGWITLLRIYNTDIGELLLEVDLLEYTISGSKANAYTAEAIDMDFDGYLDLRVLLEYRGTRNIGYAFFMWDSEAGTFVETHQFSGMELPVFDQEKQLVYSSTRGSAVDSELYTHKYINGELEHIRTEIRWWVRISQNADEYDAVKTLANVADFDIMVRFTVKEREPETQVVTVVEDKYRLYFHEPYELIWECDVDSETGLKISYILEQAAVDYNARVLQY